MEKEPGDFPSGSPAPRRGTRLTKIFEGASEIRKRIISDDILGRL